ncbi:MAG: type II toxin-antitoxin system VapC family toxin [Limisphaerales bacterium]
MIGIDANLLVALAAKEHPCHSQAVRVFDRELTADEEIVLSPSVAAEFLHVVTDPRRLTPALDMNDALVRPRDDHENLRWPRVRNVFTQRLDGGKKSHRCRHPHTRLVRRP